MEEVPAVVLENGVFTIKAGWAGEIEPLTPFRSVVLPGEQAIVAKKGCTPSLADICCSVVRRNRIPWTEKGDSLPGEVKDRIRHRFLYRESYVGKEAQELKGLEDVAQPVFSAVGDVQNWEGLEMVRKIRYLLSSLGPLRDVRYGSTPLRRSFA